MRKPTTETQLARINDVLVTRLNVQDRDSIKQAIETGIARFGRIDALINNAGYGQYGLFEAIRREKIQEQFDVNVFGVMDVARAIHLPTTFRMPLSNLCHQEKNFSEKTSCG
jgi:NAD(P)-dependent dehydrogenase (short-subunit alcohol dehydrogenase family)